MDYSILWESALPKTPDSDPDFALSLVDEERCQEKGKDIHIVAFCLSKHLEQFFKHFGLVKSPECIVPGSFA
jgi:hypothetical protein